MIQTIIIYISLIAITISFAAIARKTKRFEFVVFAISLYAILFGMRYGVGVDYPMYLQTYITPIENGAFHFEPGFVALIETCQFLDFHFSIFFGIVAFLQLYLIFKSIKEYPDIYPYLMTTFMVACIWLSYANGLRQILAVCFFVLAITQIGKKRVWLHYALLILAILMHKSAVILLLFYPLFRAKRIWFSNIKLQLLLFISAIVISQFDVMDMLSKTIDDAATLLGYDNYLEDQYAQEMEDKNINIGLGYIITAVINFIIIVYSNKVKEEYKNTWMPIAYNLFFIGIILHYIFIYSLLVGRINYYFYGFDYIMGAFTLAYLAKRNKFMFAFQLGLYCLTFVAVMSRMEENTALFRFFWDAM